MTTTTATRLTHYQEFKGINPETGTLRNALAYQGLHAPHTSAPISEALLFGISGGVVAMYFVFEHAGYDAQFHFVTRNSFDPFQKIIERLHIPTQRKQTDKPDKAHANLQAALDSDKPALVWGDSCQFPYQNTPAADDLWLTLPFIVYGMDETTAYIADRAQVPLSVTQAELQRARSRVKSLKHAQMTLDLPDTDTFIPAVQAGIAECIRSMSGEAPVKQLVGRYGLDAYTKWAALLVDTQSKDGWAKKFADAQRLVAALITFYEYTNAMYTGANGARSIYADFLDEAAILLNKPALRDASAQWRQAATAWEAMYATLLPVDVAGLSALRQLIDRDYSLFITQGGAALPERQHIRQQISQQHKTLADDFPLTAPEIAHWREHLREKVLQIRAVEAQALAFMQAAF